MRWNVDNREDKMNYWVIKVDPKINDVAAMLVAGKLAPWHTGRSLPRALEHGDALYIWATSPTLMLVGVATYMELTTETNDEGKRRFIIHYETPYLETGLDIEVLRFDKALNAEQEPSFLKSGPGGTFYSLTDKQGLRLAYLIKRKLDYSLSTPTPSTTNLVEYRRYTICSPVRNPTLSIRVKEMYDYCCQVCGTALKAGTKKYAEAAHIRGRGQPHLGSDTIDNVLCLCPNHHKLFDMGAFFIEPDLGIPLLDETLTVNDGHCIDIQNLQYHKNYFQTA